MNGRVRGSLVLLQVLALGAASCLGACRGEEQAETVILVVLDGVSTSSIERARTFAEFASGATRYTDAVAVSTGTNAALASLVTGLPPWAHGVGSLHRRGRGRLSEGLVTLAEHFRDAGFRTLAAVPLPQLSSDFSGLLQGYDEVFEPELDAAASWNATDVWAAIDGPLEEQLAGAESVHAMIVFSDARDPASGPPPGGALLRARLEPFAGQDARLAAALDKARSDPAAALRDIESHLGRSRGSAPWHALKAARRDAALAAVDEHFARLLRLLERTQRASRATVCVVGLRGAPLEVGRAGAEDGPAFPAEVVAVPLLVRAPGVEARSIARTVQPRALHGSLLASQGLAPAGGTPRPGGGFLPGLGLDGPAGGPAFCVGTHVTTGAAFDGDLQVELDGAAGPAYFRRADGERLAVDALDPERRAALEKLAGILSNRLADPRWCIEAAAGSDLRVGWNFADGEALAVDAGLDAPVRLSAAGRSGSAALEAASGAGHGALTILGSRPDLPLRLRLAGDALDPFEPQRVWLGPRHSGQVPVLWLPTSRRAHTSPPSGAQEAGTQEAGAQEDPGGPDEGAAARLAHESGAWWGLEVSGAEGPVRALLALWPPGPVDEELELELAGAEGLVEEVRGRQDALWVTGQAPLAVRVRKEPDRDLALFVVVGRRPLPPQRLFVGDRPYATGAEVELYLPDWLPGVTDAVDRAVEAPPAPGAVRITRSDRARSKRLAFDAEELAFVRRLGEAE